MRADGPLEAARGYFGEHVTVGTREGTHWPVLNHLSPSLPQHPDGQTATIGTVYLVDED